MGVLEQNLDRVLPRELENKLKELPSPPGGWVTRFAPSPTGLLHLGHLYSALWVWAVARVLSATVVLRIEDHDRQRCKGKFVDQIRRDLEFLGFQWHAEVLQSEQFDRFPEFLGKLPSYRCRCSRLDFIRGDDELFYPGTCRDLALGDELGTDTSLRVRIPDTQVEVDDLLLGPDIQTPSKQCGDFNLVDKKGNYTYQLAVVVSDLLEGVNMVVRGQDLLRSSGRQVILNNFFGVTSPRYLHHPLVNELGGVHKLSKRSRSESICGLRDAGVPAAGVYQELWTRLD